MSRFNRAITRVVATFLVAFCTMLFTTPQAQAAGGGLCTAVGDRSPSGATVMQLVCSGAPELAGVWNLALADGVVHGTNPNGGTLDGTYVEVRCAIEINVSVTICIWISAWVCTPFGCVWVDIWICIRINARICILAAGPFNGEGAYLSGLQPA